MVGHYWLRNALAPGQEISRRLGRFTKNQRIWPVIKVGDLVSGTGQLFTDLLIGIGGSVWDRN